MAITEAVIAEELTRLSIILTKVEAQYAAEKAQMLALAGRINGVSTMTQRMGFEIQSATRGTAVGYRESKMALDQMNMELQSAAAKLI